MTEGAPVPIPGHAALLLPARPGGGAEVAVSDLHIGLGYSGREGLGLAEATSNSMAERLVRLAAEASATGVVVVGDLKHPIVGAPAPVGRLLFEFCSHLLSEGLAVSLILGNHDVGVARHLPREVSVLPASGLRRGNVGLFHGHRWPTNSVLAAETLVCGHLHPGFRLAESGMPEGGKHGVWVRTQLAPSSSARKVRHRLRARELIVLPAFNPLSGIEALNREAPAHYRSFLTHRFLARGRSRAYLLDGTDLGALPSWEEPRAPKRPSPAR
jgi:hypothetical protein